MTKKTISAVVSIFATTTLLAATETVVKPAGDGANTITQEIDLETGNVISERMTCVHVAPKAGAETIKVLRLEVHSNGDAETAYVVGVDGVKCPVVLVTPDEFDMLTTRLDIMWEYFNSSRNGRVKLHGHVVNTTIDEVAKEKVETHKDGYQHREKIPAKVDRPKVVFKQKPDMAPPPKPTNISERQYEMRKRLAERRKNPVKTLTVEHDATTGTDKVIKEEVKEEK